jgi:subfamily B ATP-binding cassette protein MsbA
VLVLDEATSALDESTEASVVETLERLKDSGRTIVIIAHRTSTVSQCDSVIRLDEGRLVDSGSFASVMGPAGRRAATARTRSSSPGGALPSDGKVEGLSGS